MNKEFIPYKQALALKGLGFDDLCVYYVNQHNKCFIYNFETHPDEFVEWCGGDVIKSPTYQQAFRWFREKHKLHGYCDYYRDEYWEYYIGDINDNDIDVITKGNFKTYEEAEQACLDKLIEIVKRMVNLN